MPFGRLDLEDRIAFCSVFVTVLRVETCEPSLRARVANMFLFAFGGLELMSLMETLRSGALNIEASYLWRIGASTTWSLETLHFGALRSGIEAMKS